jgi:hypothetical protein
MERELDSINLAVAVQGETEQYKATVEPASTDEAPSKPRSHLRIFAILVALFVSQSYSSI